jgi:hypothetical protein
MTDFNAIELSRLTQTAFIDIVESRSKYLRQLEQIEALCRRHAHPGCNSGAHELAIKVLRIIRGEKESDHHGD